MEIKRNPTKQVPCLERTIISAIAPNYKKRIKEDNVVSHKHCLLKINDYKDIFKAQSRDFYKIFINKIGQQQKSIFQRYPKINGKRFTPFLGKF